MEATVGGLSYKFKIRKRRNVLFFEDILANYVEECEKAGHIDEMKDAGREWGGLTVKVLVPNILKKLPIHIFLNTVMGKVWVNLGLMDSFVALKKGDIIEIKVKNEVLTRITGRTVTSIGFYGGIIGFLHKSRAECIDSMQTREACWYKYKITDIPFDVASKAKNKYMKLNYMPEIKGFTLKDALEKNIFQLDEKNRICFRKRPIPPVENTVFHMLGNKGVLMERVPHIAHDYFKELIQDSSDEEKLVFLKTLLQVMGWGKIRLLKDPKRLKMVIDNPPHGLQKEKDNWNLLIGTILGYLWLIDKDFKIADVKEGHKRLTITYTAAP